MFRFNGGLAMNNLRICVEVERGKVKVESFRDALRQLISIAIGEGMLIADIEEALGEKMREIEGWL